jgi:hypothetical protein
MIVTQAVVIFVHQLLLFATKSHVVEFDISINSHQHKKTNIFIAN